MKIAIPTADGKLCMHFGHCQKFALIDVNDESKDIISETYVEPPAHEPGVFPKWLGEKKVNIIIAGGMGTRAQGLFNENGIKVITGASAEEPKKIVQDFLKNNLVIGDNVCDH